LDNQEVIAAHLRPPLSTIALPHYEIGVAAVRLLLGIDDTVDNPLVRDSIGVRLPVAG
jgi:LacI family transcriptional regulator